MTENRGRAAGLANEGVQIFDLALDGVRRVLAAVAPTSTVVGEHGETLGQHGREFHPGPEGSRAEGAHDQDDGRTLPDAFVTDDRAILRNDPTRHDRLLRVPG